MAKDQTLISRGRYVARLAEDEADLLAAAKLRALCFGLDAPDRDKFDDFCRHVLIEDLDDGALTCCYRMQVFENGRGLDRSYAMQFYDLKALRAFKGPMLELGRFCIHPDYRDPDILRIAWGAMTAYVDENGIEMLFGCSSFAGTEGGAYLDTFALLKQAHMAPDRWFPGEKAAEVFRFDAKLPAQPDQKRGMQGMPPLLRTYLTMGGWVSDHAVVDYDMNTLHVFTGLEIDAIPPARQRLLRAVAR